eukprot:7080449-Prymnesium_polylepis.1
MRAIRSSTVPSSSFRLPNGDQESAIIADRLACSVLPTSDKEVPSGSFSCSSSATDWPWSSRLFRELRHEDCTPAVCKSCRAFGRLEKTVDASM